MSHTNVQDLPWAEMPLAGFSGKGLLDLPNGSFKMVKIEPGSEYPIHKHPDKTEFAYVVAGTLEATIGDQVTQGESGAFFIFPVGERHGLKNPGSVDTLVLIGAVKDNA